MSLLEHLCDWPKYEKLESSDSNSSQVSEPAVRCCLISRRIERFVWLFVVILLIICNIVSMRSTIGTRRALNDTYETGFATDLIAAVPHIRLKNLVYTGGVEKHPNGTMYLNLTGSSALYVGNPTPELERNWDDLEAAISVILDDRETRLKNGMPVGTMHEPGQPGMFRVSIDVIHSLHCVNQLRKAVYADHYFPESRRSEFFFVHMNHCIEHIRQAIQCHSDLTPLVYEWDDEKKSGSPIWTSEHTCRDFDQLLAWNRKRTGKSLFGKDD
ncbi:hypothetical protein COCC4DRAFT_209516 [Bipolaris maydis ATCC 48331]|uniref:Uncharacterized protein n=2 Tax=Cochliobolus heterostrophus TaxID=5016 RepID=M2SHN0_COCH5|nr:uncharacterized protein COCC4DRAFT_209516 [Bipolaris maydis ATCC 48331]EMD84885.1 hypothetical protein COCHEDRAFT_1208230 [Bipolaris maydis C5]KAJ5021993.1 hypothetical protein J3E73DRAFT_219914 [Bipolaris maydis]ENH98613.1 hypothetical protein COCC4DRAFT_209516 [Bipolaris maydis ATCC 48331]KAJ5055160.1 hypothetical protein J3E74DRAFT_422479 [Bipolaris maydis]KAJ6203036.1 hypothetical protein J3E72DRAFT_280939 [Bipolaris maydis]